MNSMTRRAYYLALTALVVWGLFLCGALVVIFGAGPT